MRIIGFLAGGKEVSIKAKAGAWFPFLFFRSKDDVTQWRLNHELIHFRQQIELLIIGAWILKFFEKIYARFFLKKSVFESYLYTALEQEAYLNQNDDYYLRSRKFLKIFYYVMNKRNFIPDPVNSGKLIYKK